MLTRDLFWWLCLYMDVIYVQHTTPIAYDVLYTIYSTWCIIYCIWYSLCWSSASSRELYFANSVHPEKSQDCYHLWHSKETKAGTQNGKRMAALSYSQWGDLDGSTATQRILSLPVRPSNLPSWSDIMPRCPRERAEKRGIEGKRAWAEKHEE